MTDPPWWLAAVHTYPCPHCGAEPHEPCRTRNGRPASQPHAARGRDEHRCIICHVLLPHDQDPGDTLCGRCSLVRALELERARYHQREKP
jgi:hypothetical protein